MKQDKFESDRMKQEGINLVVVYDKEVQQHIIVCQQN